MKSALVTYLGLVSYFVVATVVAVLLTLPAWVAATMLFGLPTLWLVYILRPATSFVLVITGISFVTALCLQLIGHAYGIWYELSDASWRLLGLVPLESIWYTFLSFLFILCVHEYFIDDRYIESTVWNRRQGILFGAFVAFLVIAFLVTFLLPPITMYAYTFLLCLLLGMLIGTSYLLRGEQSLVVEKVLLSVGIVLPFLVASETVSLLNFYWVFGNEPQYLYSFTWLGETVPLEKVISIILLPTALLLIHEWFFDDNQ